MSAEQPSWASDDLDDDSDWTKAKQLPPVKRQKKTKKQWSPQSIAIGNLLLVLACVVLVISALAGIVIGIRIAYVKVDAAGLLTAKTGNTTTSEELVKESFREKMRVFVDGWEHLQDGVHERIETQRPRRLENVGFSMKKSENLLLDYDGVLTAQLTYYHLPGTDAQSEIKEALEFHFNYEDGDWVPNGGFSEHTQYGKTNIIKYTREYLIGVQLKYEDHLKWERLQEERLERKGKNPAPEVK